MEVEGWKDEVRKGKRALEEAGELQAQLQDRDGEVERLSRTWRRRGEEAREERAERQRAQERVEQLEDELRQQKAAMMDEMRLLTELRDKQRRSEEEKEQGGALSSSASRLPRASELHAADEMLDGDAAGTESKQARYERAKRTLKQAYDTLIVTTTHTHTWRSAHASSLVLLSPECLLCVVASQYAENNVSILLAQKDKATQQILHLTQQLAQRDLTIQQLNAQLAAASQHATPPTRPTPSPHCSPSTRPRSPRRSTTRTAPSTSKRTHSSCTTRSDDASPAAATAALPRTEPHVSLLRQQARDWRTGRRRRSGGRLGWKCE